MTSTNTVDYTDPAVLTAGVQQGWAEPITDPTRIDWPQRQAEAAIWFPVVDGRPVNPCQKTQVQRGRNGLGRWGENQMADALVECWFAGRRFVLLVERGDGHGWAIPGGGIEPGEPPVFAAGRELEEETGLTIPLGLWQTGTPTYVPDPRASDEAWAVTRPSRADLGHVVHLPKVTGDDDAKRAEWVHASSYGELENDLHARLGGRVFPAHRDLLKDFTVW